MANDLVTQKTLLERYSDMTEIRALLQLIPFGIGSAIDSYAGNKANQMKIERIELLLRSFSEDLSKIDAGLINKEYIDSEEFYLLFNKALGAAENENRKEKIRFIKNLLIDAITEKSCDTDLINAIADILIDMTYTECLMLMEIYKSNNKSKSYQSFSSVNNVLAPYFISKMRGKGLLESTSQILTLTDAGSRLIDVITEHE